MEDGRDVVVRTTDVVKRYGEGEAAVRALDGVTCEIYSGEYLSIMGPSVPANRPCST